MAKEKEETDKEKSSGVSTTKLIIVIVVLQLVMFGGFGAFLYFSGAVGGGGSHDVAAAKEGHAEESADEEEAPPIYIALEPAFVVNFSGDSGASRFMQVTLQVMTREPEVEVAVTTHMPVIRNSILLLLSSQSVEGVAGVEGKEKLRAEVLENIRKILEQRTGKPGVEEVYFTSFVIQ